MSSTHSTVDLAALAAEVKLLQVELKELQDWSTKVSLHIRDMQENIRRLIAVFDIPPGQRVGPSRNVPAIPEAGWLRGIIRGIQDTLMALRPAPGTPPMRGADGGDDAGTVHEDDDDDGDDDSGADEGDPGAKRRRLL